MQTCNMYPQAGMKDLEGLMSLVVDYLLLFSFNNIWKNSLSMAHTILMLNWALQLMIDAATTTLEIGIILP